MFVPYFISEIHIRQEKKKISYEHEYTCPFFNTGETAYFTSYESVVVTDQRGYKIINLLIDYTYTKARV